VVDQESVRFIRRAIQRTSDWINRRYGGIIDRVRRIFVVELAVRTAKELSEDDVSHMAAGVAYYALFSIFPLLLGLIAVMGFFLEPDQVEARVQDMTSGFLPGSEQLVADNISAVIGFRGALGVFSLLGLLWSGSAMFGALNRAINRAWDIHTDRPIYINKPRQLLMAMSVGALFTISLSSAAVVRTSEDLERLDIPVLSLFAHTAGQIALQVISLSLMIVIFLMIYKFMPNTKTYWKYVWPGAITGALLFELAKNLFIVYLGRWASYQNVYGSIAPVIVLLLWAYVSSLILLLGAEISSEYERLKHNLERGVLRHQRHKPSRVPGGPH
jgi:membrane protein